ncbi:hypothetical protein SAMN05421637_0712 [Demequina mangrovi]|uniref:DUF5667 domain-containing protein n=2 Tax=Demequina mangrovi TaxID=1043493 RepID=A0A1H6VIN5_9MICO|nr:hypothetical protein [Demequina mangrovi]SEJ00590.1 hypothetical protein SAMN05421637_0712 [Demequina mangrovi]
MTHDEHADQTARDLDRLLAGKEPASLSDVAGTLEGLRALNMAPTAEDADRAGSALASIAAAQAAPAAAPARPARRRAHRIRAAIAGAAALAAVGLVGGTAAADEAAPGDALYGLDRALERLGLGAGGMDERLAEALRVVEDGDDEGALALVDEIVSEVLTDEEIDAANEEPEVDEESLDAEADSTGDDDAAEGDGAEKGDVDVDGVLADGPGVSREVHECLRDILDWMSTTDAEGRDFGQGVAERYRDLRHSWFESRHGKRHHGDKVLAEDVDGTTETEAEEPALAEGDEVAPDAKPEASDKPELADRPDATEKSEGDSWKRDERTRDDESADDEDAQEAPARGERGERGSQGDRSGGSSDGERANRGSEGSDSARGGSDAVTRTAFSR